MLHQDGDAAIVEQRGCVGIVLRHAGNFPREPGGDGSDWVENAYFFFIAASIRRHSVFRILMRA